MFPGSTLPLNDRLPEGSQSTALEIRLLGQFRVALGDRVINELDWRLRNAAHLVKILALAPGRTLHREQIIDLLWPDRDPESGARNLRYALHIARRVLRQLPGVPENCLALQGERLALGPDSQLWIDVEAFETAANSALKEQDAHLITAALELYRGDLLPADRYEDWASAPRERLRETYLLLLTELARIHQASGALVEAIGVLRKAVEADPAHEAAHVQLMKLYAATGQRHQALRQYQRLCTSLRDELDIEPEPATQRLYAEIESGRLPALEPARPLDDRVETPSPSVNLPVPLTSFVGRRRELTRLPEALQANRLVTIAGPGGAGKTRLATEVGHRLALRFPGGVWLVDLAPVTDAGLVPGTVAATLGLTGDGDAAPLESLEAGLPGQDLLLILDNCEHLAGACARLAGRLLRGCPQLRILATSREPLHVEGELIWRIAPLDLPDPGHAQSLQRLARNEAVQLFIERARLVRPDWQPTHAEARSILEICRKLEGLPLAIELAAARLASLSLDQLRVRIDDSIHLLASPGRDRADRQRTMTATVDWSYGLLTATEQTVWRRLAVFSGSWSLEAAEAVASGAGVDASEILDTVARLVDKSMVTVDLGPGESRYRLLEILRQYAGHHLETSGEMQAVQRRHALYYASLAELAEPGLGGSEQLRWLRRLSRDHDNFRSALRYLSRHDVDDHFLRLSSALARFWLARGHYQEGRDWIVSALESARVGASVELRSRALAGIFQLAYRQGDFASARDFGEQHLALMRSAGDRQGIAWSLIHLAMAVGELGDLDGSENFLEQGLSASRKVGDIGGVARALNSLGEIARIRGEHYRAAGLYRESLANWREIGDRQYIAMVLHNLAYALLAGDQFQAGAGHFQESLQLYREAENPDGIAACLTGLACVAAAAGQPEQALRLFAAADELREQIGSPEDAADRLQSQRYETLAHSQLPDAAAERAWSSGRALQVDEATSEALALAIPASPTIAGREPSASLSPREREIAGLIVSGSTNAQIAAALGISRRTVDKHVSNILHKLGLNSRTEIDARISDRS